MSGLFQLLGVGARSLLANQLAQSTVGNNAANVATPGYSRRRTRLTEAAPTMAGLHMIGMGVQASGVERLRDRLIDSQFRLDTRDLAFARTQADLLDHVGAALSPADASSLGGALDDLWAGFGDLAARPEDAAVRQTLLGRARRFVDAVTQTGRSLEGLTSDASTAIRDAARELNDLAERVAVVNAGLKARPLDPSLADERDRLVDRLAELVGVRVTLADDGVAHVVVDGTGIQIVDGLRAASVTVSGAPVAGTLTLAVDGIALAEPGGEIGGALRVRNSSTDGLPHALAALDELAGGVIAAVNRVHGSGAGLALPASITGSVTVTSPTAMLDAAGLAVTPTSGTLSLGVFDGAGALVSTSSVAVNPATLSLAGLASALDALPNVSASVSGGRLTLSATNTAHRLALGADGSDTVVALGLNGFFTGSDARTIGLNPDLVTDPSLIAAARADLTAGVVSPGDGRNAAALHALGESQILAGGTATPAALLGGLGATIGAAGQAARSRATTLETVVQAVEAQRLSVSGVNLDEELADMVRYQHAYEASARFVRTVDEMIRTVLDMV